MEISKTRTWLRSVGAAIELHPFAAVLVGLSAGYLLALRRAAREETAFARALARRVLMTSASVLASAAFADHGN